MVDGGGDKQFILHERINDYEGGRKIKIKFSFSGQTHIQKDEDTETATKTTTATTKGTVQ